MKDNFKQRGLVMAILGLVCILALGLGFKMTVTIDFGAVTSIGFIILAIFGIWMLVQGVILVFGQHKNAGE